LKAKKESNKNLVIKKRKIIIYKISECSGEKQKQRNGKHE